MTLPQSPASPLPEASEPVAWQHLKAYGYAPGNYMNKCRTCGKVVEFVDKRAITCRPCAEARHAAAPSPVAQAPAQAGEVARLPSDEEIWSNDLIMAANASAGLPMLALGLLVRNSLRAFATQPLAAPVQQEAWKPTEDQILAAAEKAGLWPNTVHHWIGAFDRFFDALALATPPAQPVLAPVVREPLSDERIDQLFLDAHAEGYGMGWQECGRRFARAVIQATTGEQSHG